MIWKQLCLWNKSPELSQGDDCMSENQNIEWKESWRDEYLKWICGFANAQGGKIYIGTDDKGNARRYPK